MKTHVKLKVPATTANIGPGFDCIGLALDIWNTLEVTVGRPEFKITGRGHNSLPHNQNNLIYQSIERIFQAVNKTVPELSIACHNEIPLTGGLGSSSAALISGLFAGNALCDYELTDEDLLQIAVELEGHPDNVSPALLGGFQVGVSQQGKIITTRIPVPDNLVAVIYVPNVAMPTTHARSVLDSCIPRKDAVFNIGRVALLIHAFTTGDLTNLAVATEDRLHQPQRQSIFFPMKNIFRAAISAGALGVFLSGAGSAVLAFTTEREYTIGYEMADAATKSGLDGEIIITLPSQTGAHIIEIA